MAHHVIEANPTHPITECGATREILDGLRAMPSFHMCGLPDEHASVHCCGECGAKWSDI